MNSKLLSIYLADLQPKKLPKAMRIEWIDRNIALMVAVSLGALLLKYAGEALAETLLK